MKLSAVLFCAVSIIGLFYFGLPRLFLINAANDHVPPGCQAIGVGGCMAGSGQVSCVSGLYGYCCPSSTHCDCVKQSGYVFTALGCLPANDLNEFAGWFVSKAIYVASGIVFLLMVYGGFLLLTSSGDPSKVKAGSELISAALSGLLFIIVSVLLLRVIGFDLLRLPGFI